ALAGIRQHAEDIGTRLRTAAQVERAGQGGSGGNSGEYPLLQRKLARATQRIVAADRYDRVDQSGIDRILGELGDEVGRPALHEMRPEQRMALARPAIMRWRLRDTARQHRRVVRFA